MAITLVQKNGSASIDTMQATPPAWSTPPVAGNLLIIVGAETNNTNSTWPTTPTGYTAVASTPFQFYPSGTDGAHGMFWKIATGGDATPGVYGESTGTQDWVTYTYEFAAPGGWIASAVDKEVHSAASSTAVTTKASGATAVLAQANELAVAMNALSVVGTAGSFSNGFTLATPTTSDGKLWVGWLETASTAALSTTASWTTSARAGVRIVTFKTVGGTAYTQSVAGALRFTGAAPVKGSARRLPGALSFAGTRSGAPKTRLTAGSFTPSGALGQQQSLVRTLLGAFTPGGALNRENARTLAASIVPAGALTSLRSVAKALTGALSFVGSSTRLPAKALSGVFRPVGVETRSVTLHQTLDAAVLAPTADLFRLTSRRLTAAIRAVGMVITASRAPLTGVFRPTAAAVSHGLPARTLFATLQATSTLGRFTARQLVSSLIASSVLNTHYLPPVTPPFPGGGGFGALMSDEFFKRYEVDAKWRHMKRVRVK